MGRIIGMNPDHVQERAASLRYHLGALSAVASTIDAVVAESRSSNGVRVPTGSLVVAPHSLGHVAAAGANVRAALEAAHELVAELYAQADDQREASAATKGRGRAPTDSARAVEHNAPDWLEDLPGWLMNPWYGAAALIGHFGDLTPLLERTKMWVLRGEKIIKHANGALTTIGVRAHLWGRNWAYRDLPLALRHITIQPPDWTRDIGRSVPLLARGARVLGPVGAAVGAVLDGVESGAREYEQSGDWGRVAGKATISAASSAAGGLAGAAAGAAVGAAIGSVFPGPGTVIGAVVGGIVGGVGVGEAGSQLGEWINSLW